MKPEDEMIIGFFDVDVNHIPDGFTPYGNGKLIPIDRERVHDGRRGSTKEIHAPSKGVSSMETNFKIRQLIAYTVLTRLAPVLDAEGVQQTTDSGVPLRIREFLLYKRSKMTTENRLADRYSIGFGGHVSGADWAGNSFSLDAVIEETGKRELSEELEFSGKDGFPARFKVIGTVKENATDVDKVHIGIVLLAKVNYGVEVTEKEEAIELQGWKDAAELYGDIHPDTELWSQHLIKALVDLPISI